DRDIGSGPGKLSQAMGITGELDGADLVGADRGVAIVSDGLAPPRRPAVGPRIGISKAVDFPWRWHVPGHEHVSVRSAKPRQLRDICAPEPSASHLVSRANRIVAGVFRCPPAMNAIVHERPLP